MGRTAPNPPVAAVVIATRSASPGEPVLFAGGTEPAGGRHAEIVALDRCRADGGRPARLYVTLEPCATFGRTPPCTDRIIGEGALARIIFFQNDPAQPKRAVLVLGDAGRRAWQARVPSFQPGPAFLAGFLGRVTGTGPRLHLKCALSVDGYMAGAGAERLLISGIVARRFTMALRSRMDAVLVGPGTVAGDLPGLDVRPPEAGPAFDFAKIAPAARANGDLFLEALCEHFDAVTRQAADRARQPDRIFLLGRPFPGQGDFFTKQNAIAGRTGRAAVYLTTASYAATWLRRAATVLPDLADPDFARSLRIFFSARGYNEVLVEGGPTLLGRLAREPGPDDRGAVLRSRVRRAGRGRPGPTFAGRAETYDLGDDALETFRIRTPDAAPGR